MTERMRNIDIALIYELWREFTIAINTGDVELWLSLYTDDCLQIGPDKPRRTGKKQLKKEMLALLFQQERGSLAIQIEEVRNFGAWAYSQGRYEFAINSPDEERIVKCSGDFLDILEKQIDGSWKIAIDSRHIAERCVQFEGQALRAVNGDG